MNKDQNENAPVENESTEEVETVEEETVAVEEITSEPTPEELQKESEEFFKDVDDLTKEVLEVFGNKDVTMIVETLANVINVTCETINADKAKVVQAIYDVIANRYPTQHPLVKCITLETGMQAGINFMDDILYILEDSKTDTPEEEKATVINLKDYTITKNDYEIEEEKLNNVIKFFKESYNGFKQELVMQIEKNKAEALSKETEEEQVAEEVNL